MSLTKKRTLTEKRIAANQANGKRSRGPATPQGRERIRDADLRHGFYSQDQDNALRTLGENPQEFDAVVKSVMEKWPPADGFEERLAMRLARAMWRMERGDRMQEGYALRQAKEVGQSRESRLHAEMMRLKMRATSLQLLAQSVAQEHYVTTPADLDQVKSLRDEGAMKELGDIAVALFYQLQEPGAPGPGEGETEEGEDPEVEARRVINSCRAIFGLGPLDPAPEAEVAPASSRPKERRQDAGATRESQQEAGAAEAEVAPASSRPKERRQDAGATRESQQEAGAAEAEVAPASSRPQERRQDAGATRESQQEAGAAEAEVAPASSRPQERRQDAGATRESQQEAGAAEAEEDERYPNISSEEWEAREPVRHLLENILKRQVELCEAERIANLRECVKGPSPYERAAEIAPIQRNAILMRRMEDASFRQVARITSLLLKIKRRAREKETSEGSAKPLKVHENKAG